MTTAIGFDLQRTHKTKKSKKPFPLAYLPNRYLNIPPPPLYSQTEREKSEIDYSHHHHHHHHAIRSCRHQAIP